MTGRHMKLRIKGRESNRSDGDPIGFVLFVAAVVLLFLLALGKSNGHTSRSEIETRQDDKRRTPVHTFAGEKTGDQ